MSAFATPMPMTDKPKPSPPGGGFAACGTAFAAGIRSADATLLIVPRNSACAMESVGPLTRGEVDLTLVAGTSRFGNAILALSLSAHPRLHPAR